MVTVCLILKGDVMGVEYSYYDGKRNLSFEMGKWYCWENPIENLWSPNLVGLIREHVKDWGMSDIDKESYARWLASKLAAFREGTASEYVSWVNDCDDSDDVIDTCLNCDVYKDDCECAVPNHCKLFGSRYTEDYDDNGVFKVDLS